MNPTPTTVRRAAAGALAGALTLALAAASPVLAAAPPFITSTPGGTLSDLDGPTVSSLEYHGDSLLLADGRFGAALRDFSQIDGPLQVFSYGRRVDGASESIGVEGSPAGVPGTPTPPVSGAEGYNWVLQYAVYSGSSYTSPPHLTGFDDRGRAVRVLSLPRRSGSTALAATGAGLRVLVGTDPRDDTGTVIRNSSGRRLGNMPRVSSPRAVVGRSDGSMVMSGYAGANSPWGSSLLRVSAGGTASFLRDAQGQRIEGDPLAQTGGGLVFSPTSRTAFVRPGGKPVLAIRSPRGSVLTRSVSTFDLPWNPRCDTDPSTRYELSWAVAGPSGGSIVGVSCARDADRTKTYLDGYVVGLDRKLRAKWAFKPGYSQYGGVSELFPKAQLGADGRLWTSTTSWEASPLGTAELRRWRAPGTPAPRRGRVLSVARSGDGAVATIRCNLPEGSVCSGTARLSRGGRAVTTPYALYGRPGAKAAVIRRHFDRVPAGRGPLRVTLSR